MNAIMLLFTIATILYLPPMFVAVIIPRIAEEMDAMLEGIPAGSLTDSLQTIVALDPFEVTDRAVFWNIFAITSAVTYVLAAMGLLTIYRKGFPGQGTFWVTNPISNQRYPVRSGKDDILQEGKEPEK